MGRLVICRYCRGPRPTSRGLCLGCGAPVERAELHERKRTRKPRKCPKCGSGNYQQARDEGRFECRGCSAVFEDDDFEFLDTRPHINAIKKERRRA